MAGDEQAASPTAGKIGAPPQRLRRSSLAKTARQGRLNEQATPAQAGWLATLGHARKPKLTR